MRIRSELQELRTKDKKDLFKEIPQLQKKLTELRLGQVFRKLKNYQEITQVRRRIARVWTILGEKILEEQYGNKKDK